MRPSAVANYGVTSLRNDKYGVRQVKRILTTGSASPGTFQFDYPILPTSGIVLTIGNYNGGATPTFTTAGALTLAVNLATQNHAAIWYFPNHPGGTDTLSISSTVSNDNYFSGAMMEVVGMFGYSPLGATGTHDNNTTNGWTVTASTINPQARMFVATQMSNYATTNDVGWFGCPGYTEAQNVFNTNVYTGAFAAYKYIKNLETSSCVYSNSTGSAGNSALATFKMIDTPPTATVLAAKSSADGAPTPGNLQYQSQTVSFLGANAFPDLSFDRHYTSGAGIGSADFFTVTKPYFYPTSWDTLGGPTNGENDGSNAAFWTTKKDMGSVQNNIGVYVGFQTPSRYIWIPSQASRVAQLRVDGKLLPANTAITYPANNQMAKIDLGSVGTGAGRKIVLQGSADFWVAEVSVSAGSAIIPYDWMADANKVTASFMGDSYQQGGDYSLVGLPFIQYIAELCGFGAITASSIGGSGYGTANSSDPVAYPSFLSSIRLNVVTRDTPQVHICQGGINDPGDSTTTTAMQNYYSAIRSALPNALIVAQTAWAPVQSDGANPAGKYQAMRTALYNTMANIAGPWIIIDNLAGTWRTSRGTASTTATGAWQTGNGRVGATTGSGNGDTWVSSDGTHPSAVGFKGLAELFATAYKAAVASMI